ncbi:hypothetical protein BD626DRAFT_496919 [Schizophyllum amplum]|uniref:Aminoglycoside phosphotransferase domain-containing protein n=1 Tax=Schizophyllum amplum TaxID=97359 RepID=A0A550CDP0_9AGAR|nr:hypothetical protein BD626DRAFT_496919 [Auriculariopsis ampla]
MATSSGIRPLFPATGLPNTLLPCPPIDKASSAFTKRICYYVHEYLLIPFSEWYMRHYDLPTEMCIFQLPFGLVLKRHGRVHEQEGQAMNLARAMGIPAPRFISFGSYGDTTDTSKCNSLLMTRVPGYNLSWYDDDAIDWDIIKEDLVRIITRMRSFSSPFGNAICGAGGGPIRGPLVPWKPPRCADEADFRRHIDPSDHFPRLLATSRSEAERAVYAAKIPQVEAFLALPEHAVVFTHGDLVRHNIFVGEDGHISGIIDWEAGAWMPDYWEFSVTAPMPMGPWGQYMDKKVSGGVYAREIKGHQALFPFIADGFSY